MQGRQHYEFASGRPLRFYGRCAGYEKYTYLQQDPSGRSGVEETNLLAQDAAEIPLPEPICLPDACGATLDRSGGRCHLQAASQTEHDQNRRWLAVCIC